MSTCKAPVALETLIALWAGELDEPQADAVEAHLFACDACSDASDRLGRLVTGLREVIPPVVSHAYRERLRERGLNMVETPVEPGIAARARFAPGVDLLVHVFHADLSQAERVDVDLRMPDGATAMSFENVPFDAKAGEVLVACQRHYRAMFPAGVDPLFVVHSVEHGERKQVGEYLVEHVWE